MRQLGSRQFWRVALALILAAELSGCLSVRTTRTKVSGRAAAGGTLDVAVYDTPAKAKADIPTSASVSLDLGRIDKGQPEMAVQSFSTPSASFGSLAPGEYRLHLKAESLDGGGTAGAPTITQESIKLAAGETVRTQVILKKFPTGAVLGVVLCVGAGFGIVYAVAAHNLSGLGKLRLSRSPAKKSVRAH